MRHAHAHAQARKDRDIGEEGDFLREEMSADPTLHDGRDLEKTFERGEVRKVFDPRARRESSRGLWTAARKGRGRSGGKDLQKPIL